MSSTEEDPLEALRAAISQDDDEAIISAFAPALEADERITVEERVRLDRARRRLDALRELRAAISQDDDKAIIRAYDASLVATGLLTTDELNRVQFALVRNMSIPASTGISDERPEDVRHDDQSGAQSPAASPEPSSESIRITRRALDAWLGIPWCDAKWQILALLTGTQLPFCDDEQVRVITPSSESAKSLDGSTINSCVEGEYAHVQVTGQTLTALRVGSYVILYKSQEPNDLPANYPARAHLRNSVVLTIEALAAPFSATQVSTDTAAKALQVKHAYLTLSPKQRERLIQLRRELPGSTEEEFSSIVAEAIVIGRGDVVTERRLGDHLFDFGVWSEALLPTVGNPLLVEVRRRLPMDAAALDHRILRQLAMSGLDWALVVYELLPSETTLSTFHSPPVLPIRASDLIEDLLAVPFDEVIRRHRESALQGQSS